MSIITEDRLEGAEYKVRIADRPMQDSPLPQAAFANIGAILGYVVLTLALTYPLVRQFATAIPGDGFDGWQNYWNQWWIKLALLDRHTSPYFTDLLYYPTGVSLLFHTLNPFNGLITLPVQLAWGLIPAYNIAVLFSFVVGGLGAYLLARQVLGPGRDSRMAAFVAGAIYTFAPFHIAHLLGHLQLIALEWIPFYALYAWRIAAGPTAVHFPKRDALLAGLFLALVGLCDWYYVLYCLILTALAVLWVAWRSLRSRAWRPFARRLGALALACALFAIILGPLLVPMMREASASAFMVPDPGQSRSLSADLLAFVTPQEFHPVWGAWARERASAFTSTVSEHQVFAGYSVLALVMLGIAAGWRGARRGRTRARPLSFWLTAALVFFVLALGPVLHIGGRTNLLPGGRELPLPYAWLASSVPFMNISRSVSRFDVMLMLALAVLAAIGLKWIRSWKRWRAGAGMVALALVVFEFWPAPYPVSPPDTPAWYGVLAADARPGAVLNLPMNWDRPGYLLYQTVHQKPLAVAYISRDDPRTMTERVPVLQHLRHLGPDIVDFDLAAQGQEVLADLGIRWVVLDRYKMPGPRERSYNEDTARLIFGNQAPVHEDERLTVYEVVRPVQSAPYLMLGEGWGGFEQGTRAFVDIAGVTVQATQPGTATLYVTLAPGAGGLAGGASGEQYVMPLELQAGANYVELRAAEAGGRVVVSNLWLEPGM